MNARGAREIVDLNTVPLDQLLSTLDGDGLVRRLVELARDEDVGPLGDVTSLASIDAKAEGEATVVARNSGVVAGLAAMPEVTRAFGGRCRFEPRSRDGGAVGPGWALGVLTGPLRDILAIERTALNLLGRLSGVATRAAEFVAALGTGTRARVFDTRKTTPGMRVLEKYAVRCGGACCHRVGLFDAVLIKDNHIAGVPLRQLGQRVASACRAARERSGGRLRFVEVEVDSLEQLREVLSTQARVDETSRVDIVLLDNMTPAQLAACVRERDRAVPRIELEASGGITLESIRAIGQTGVERISTGSMTHGATWLDIGLDM